MVYPAQPVISIFEGDEDRWCHWFICETIWVGNDVNNEEKQIHQFVVGLTERALTWFMNYINNPV